MVNLSLRFIIYEANITNVSENISNPGKTSSIYFIKTKQTFLFQKLALDIWLKFRHKKIKPFTCPPPIIMKT